MLCPVDIPGLSQQLLLILGCESAQVPLVHQLANQGKALPFSVLGIPPMEEF